MKNLLLIFYVLVVTMTAYNFNINSMPLCGYAAKSHSIVRGSAHMGASQNIAPCELSGYPLEIDSIKISYWYVREMTILITNHGTGYAFLKNYNGNNASILLPEALCRQTLDLVNQIFIQKEKPVIEFRSWHPEMVSTDTYPIILINVYIGGKHYERIVEYLTRIDHYDYKYSSDFTKLVNIIFNIENNLIGKEEG